MKDGADATTSIKQSVQMALDLVRRGTPADLEAAAVRLFRDARNLILRRLHYGHGNVVGMSEEDAEDNLYATIERFVRSKPDGTASGLNWLYRLIDAQALDFHRRRRAEKRGGGDIEEGFYTADDELRPDVEAAEPLFGSPEQRPGLDDCMERAVEAFEKDLPAYARVLRLVAQGLDNDDLAVEYGADPENITEGQRKNIRQRKSHALKQAREYFEPCKE